MSAINTQTLIPIIQSVASFVGSEGLYPQSLTRDEIAFGQDESDPANDEPIVRLDGVRRIKRDRSSNVLTAEIDGATFRESGRGGFLSHAVGFEKVLDAKPETLFQDMKLPLFSMNDFRPGFDSRLESSANLRFRQMIVDAKGDAALEENLHEIALDIALVTCIDKGIPAGIKVDALFLSAMLFAASKQDGAGDKAVEAFQGTMRELVQDKQYLLAAIAGDLIRYSFPDLSPNDYLSTDKTLMESWYSAVEDLSQIGADFLVPMFRGLKLALHIRHWDGAMRFFEFNEKTSDDPAKASINHLRTAWAALKSVVKAKGDEGGKLGKALGAIDRAQMLREEFRRSDEFQRMRTSLRSII